MRLYRHGRYHSIIKYLAVISCGLMLQANAQDENTPASQSEPIEEITVIGQQIILDLRLQIIEAEDRAFDIFNALNDDNLYDVVCTKVARTGTLIKKRECLPNFYHRATAENAQEFLGYVGDYSNYSGPTQSSQNMFAQRFPVFKAKVKELAMQNPELMSALEDLIELSEELKQKRDSYHGTGAR